MKCNLIVAGFAKCGTSSLHEYLDMHPEICMSSKKEPHYFSAQRSSDLGEEWYNSLFDHALDSTRYYGESSTSYSVYEPALLKIKQKLKNPKVILILRDPVERVLSHYRWMYAQGLEKLSIQRAMEDESEVSFSPDIHRSGCYPTYFRSSNYSYFVPLAQKIFGEENILLIRTELLSSQPQAVLNRCFLFLGLHEFSIESEIRANTTTEQRVPALTGLKKLYHLFPMRLRKVMSPISTAINEKLGMRVLRAPEPDKATLERIGEILAEDRTFYSKID